MEKARAIAIGKRKCYRSEHVTLGSMLFPIELEAIWLRLISFTELLLSLGEETWMRKLLFLLKQLFINCMNVSKRLFNVNYIIILFNC